MHTVRLLFCLIMIPLLTLVAAWGLNQPQDVGPDVPHGKLTSLSFAPFREGFSPLEEIFPLEKHVDEDLRLLADKTETVRTYSSLGGLQPVPALAKKHGLTVIQGAWLSAVPKDNYKEIQALIHSANANPDVVKKVIVGNEVLLRGDLKPERLIEHIREVKRSVKQPVTYADVWSMYLKYPQIINEVDFITIHILPYWEDEPVAVEEALQHLERVFKQMQSVAGGKPILIGETGWPGHGRQRGAAVPSVANEAKFIRELIQIAKTNGFDYNIVEAFNQAWKSNLEGVVGANWGLFSVNREPVFPLTGPVLEHPDWLQHVCGAIVLWLLIVVSYFRKLHFTSLSRLLMFLGFAMALAVAMVDLSDELWQTSYNPWQRVYAAVIVIANLAFALLLLQRNYQQLTQRLDSTNLAVWLHRAYLGFVLLALYKTVWLVDYGRYLSFPSEQVVVAVLGVVGLSLGRLFEKMPNNHWQQWHLAHLFGGEFNRVWAGRLCVGLWIAIPAMVLGETLAFMKGGDLLTAHQDFQHAFAVSLRYALINGQLLVWIGYLAVLSIPLGLGIQRGFKKAPAV